MLRAWRLTEVLELDDATAARLFTLLDTFDEQVGAQQSTIESAARELRTLLESGSGEDSRVSELLDQILTAHLQIETLRTQLVRDSGAFLTPRQQAALMLFLPQFDREIRELVHQVRRHGGGLRAGPSGPSEGPGGLEDLDLPSDFDLPSDLPSNP